MSLQPRYDRLKQDWIGGDRSREAALDLMFHAWMHWADPPFVTGLRDDPDSSRIWHEIYQHFGGTQSSDAEFLFVAGVMAIVTPWALGDESTWIDNASNLDQRLRQMADVHLTAARFEGRGEYGKYFAHQWRARPDTSAQPAR